VREVFSKPGESRWYPPFKHRVENLGDTAYEAVYVGIKQKVNAVVTPTSAMDEETKKIVAGYVAGAGRP
jgi:hypothetical protein